MITRNTPIQEAEKVFKKLAGPCMGDCTHRVKNLSGMGCTNLMCGICDKHVYESENIPLRLFTSKEWNNWVNDLQTC